ncbi:MAG TPA: hypothetical protein VMA09_04030 [Candidatus Binataceae bacterium]|nr:hypothetical protein [Candidatus Binataceae bacterium]
MNCFETRQEFPALWRKTATEERRAELLAHLKSCAKCDHAFRVFALTAPVLYSATEPGGRIAIERRVGALARRGAMVSRGSTWQRQMVAMCAGVMVLFMASAAAYLSVTVPVSSYSDEITNSESALDLPAADTSVMGNDFAG